MIKKDMMITLKRAKFESIAKLTMPEFFDTKSVIAIEHLEEWEKYAYHLDVPLTLNQVLDILEEQTDMLILYNFSPSKTDLSPCTCCSISNPEMERMVRISATTGKQGLCDTIYLTIFSSLEIMFSEISNEKKRMIERFNFDFEDTYHVFLTLIS